LLAFRSGCPEFFEYIIRWRHHKKIVLHEDWQNSASGQDIAAELIYAWIEDLVARGARERGPDRRQTEVSE
jgi:hypothetical protein